MIFVTIEIVSNLIEVTAEVVDTLIEVTAEIVHVAISLGGTIDVYIDGVLNQSIVSTNLNAEIVNISL